MSRNGLENNLDVLEILSEALTIPMTLDEGLNRIIRMTCRLMETEQAAFLQIDEEHQCFIIRAAIGLDSESFCVGQPLQVPDRLQSILWRLRNIHQINWVDSGIKDIKFPIIAMPIQFKGMRIGHLITGGAHDSSTTKDPIRRNLFALLGPFASLIIENAKATDLLSQRFALNSRELLKAAEHEAANGNAAERLMVNSISNPIKVVRLLAESFHRELASAGFSTGHITIAAAHILDCVLKNCASSAAAEANKPAADGSKS
ncbi:MAG: hypothetical protein GX564_00725 [Oligosphaeraceae bacterium]|nr:hypothetical protein [Oligosphaeraceae bacterium]